MSASAGVFSNLLRSEKLGRRANKLLVYMTGQGLVQLVNLSVGLLLIRWLKIEGYAQYSVAFSFQTTFSLLTDLGFAGTIVALVGPRGNDPEVVGKYIRSGRHLRNTMLAWLTPVAAILYIGISRQHHWPVVSSTLLFLSIASSIYFSGMVSYYGAPLLIRGKLSHFYRHQLYGAFFRIAGTGALYFSGAITAWTASWVNALGLLLIGWLNMRESRQYATMPVKAESKITKEMVRYVMPNLPSMVFFALQGQISLFLISFFGQTQSIAEVGALGRLGQLFLLMSGFNQAVIEPFMAKLPKERVLRSYLMILGIASAICCLLVVAGFMEPRILLLLLGSKYANLQKQTGWLIVSSCLAYLVGVTWIMGAARRWIYWTTSGVTIGMILVTQIVFLSLVRVDSTMHVVWFGVATSGAHFLSMLFNGVYGYFKGPKVEIEEHTEAESISEELAVAQED